MHKIYVLLLLWTSLTLLEACDDCPDYDPYCLTIDRLAANAYSLGELAPIGRADTVARDSFAIAFEQDLVEATCSWLPDLGSRLYACSLISPRLIDNVVEVSITSPFDLGAERVAGTELKDLFLPKGVDYSCEPRTSATCVYDLYETATDDWLVNALNEDSQEVNLLFALDATLLPPNVDRYAFQLLITLEDGRNFALLTEEVSVSEQ